MAAIDNCTKAFSRIQVVTMTPTSSKLTGISDIERPRAVSPLRLGNQIESLTDSAACYQPIEIATFFEHTHATLARHLSPTRNN